MTDDKIKPIGLQLWKYLSACVDGMINTPVSRGDLRTFQVSNYYSEEQVMQALRWCIEQEYFIDDDMCVVLVKAYQ